MRFHYKLVVFVLLMLLPALACGSESAPTSTPEISTATPSLEDSEEVSQVEESEEDVEAGETAEPTSETAIPTETSEPTPAPTDTPEAAQEANLGDLVEHEGYSLVAVTVEDPAPPGMLYTPTEGTKLVAVEIIIGNVSGERITVNPLNGTLVDAEGFTHQPELAGRDEQLILVDLEPGERVKGWISFEVPEASEPHIIKYAVSSVPSIVLQSGLKTSDGALVAESNVPLTASGDVDRETAAKLGDLIEQDGYSLVAETVEDPTTPGMLYTPTEGRKLIAVQIVVGNVSGEVVTVNPLNAFLVDTDGYVYAAEAGGRDEQLELVDLNPGERVRGWVAFEIPENATPESIRYQVSGFPLIELQTGLSE